MLQFFIWFGFAGAIMVAISLVGYRIYSGSKLDTNFENAQTDRDEKQTELKDKLEQIPELESTIQKSKSEKLLEVSNYFEKVNSRINYSNKFGISRVLEVNANKVLHDYNTAYRPKRKDLRATFLNKVIGGGISPLIFRDKFDIRYVVKKKDWNPYTIKYIYYPKEFSVEMEKLIQWSKSSILSNAVRNKISIIYNSNFENLRIIGRNLTKYANENRKSIDTIINSETYSRVGLGNEEGYQSIIDIHLLKEDLLKQIRSEIE